MAYCLLCADATFTHDAVPEFSQFMLKKIILGVQVPTEGILATHQTILGDIDVM